MERYEGRFMSQTIERNRPRKPQVRQKRAQERIELILSVTRDMVLAEGVPEITTTSIAQRAGIPVGSVYKYFGDKNDVLFALYGRVFATVMAEMTDTLRTIAPSTEFVLIVDQLFDRFLASCEEHKSYVPLTRWANAYRPELRSADLNDNEIRGIFKEALDKANVKLPKRRQDLILQTLVSLTSALVDQAFDSDDEIWRNGLINELRVVQRAYIETVNLTQ